MVSQHCSKARSLAAEASGHRATIAMFITRTFGNTQVNPADCSLIQGRMGRPKLPLTPGAEGLVHSTPVCLAVALWLVRPLREQACTEGLRQLAAASPFGEVANVTNAATSSLANHRNVRVPITSPACASTRHSAGCIQRLLQTPYPYRPGSGGGMRAWRGARCCRPARGACALGGVERAGCASLGS